MNIAKLISSIKNKIVSPAIFALEVEAFEYNVLHVLIAYSLEEALQSTKVFLSKQTHTSHIQPFHWKLKKYMKKDLTTLFDDATSLEFKTNIPAPEPKLTATPEKIIEKEEDMNNNTLMKKIVATKDIQLFKKYKHKFSNAELTLLKEKYNIK